MRKQKEVLLHKKINLAKVFSHYRVIDFDWQFHESSVVQPITWAMSISDINQHFLRYALRIPATTKLHLFLLSPCPVAIGLGYTIGKLRPWIVYHYDSQTSSYCAIGPIQIDSISRLEYQYIDVAKSGSPQGEITVVISIIPRSSLPLPHLSGYVVEISAKKPTLQPSDFAPIASEIVDCLNNLLKQGRSVFLFPGMPIAMGFAVGKELNDHANVQIYNPNRITNKWEQVLSLRDLTI